MANSNLPTQNAVSVAIDEAGRKAQGSVQWFIENKAAKDGHPAITDAPAITHGNQLTFSICGQEGFASIASDLRNAKSTADIICWGFDPGMELERKGSKWRRGTTYGDLLHEITTRATHPVRVRLLIWHDLIASVKQNNMPGFTDAKAGPVASPYANDARFEYCRSWWNDNLPMSGRSKNANLQIVLRSIDKADVKAALDTTPIEEDKPNYVFGSPLDETALLENYPTHHQKPVLIDYAYDSGSQAVGYVMGLNSTTDFWDTTAHEIDDPLRETWGKGSLEAEHAHEEATQKIASKASYRHAKPYQDYACRIVGPALERLHQNFERGWRLFAPDSWKTQEVTSLPSKIPTLRIDPANAVQIVRTQPHEREKNIKKLYFQATSYARNYIYIENQYFFYPEFARHLKNEREKFFDAWARLSDKPMADAPTLHLFIVIPHPEDDGMIPRTFDTLAELGASSAMSAQGAYIDSGNASQDYADAKTVAYNVDMPTQYGTQTVTRTHKVLDRPSVKTLQDTTGMKVSVARLRTSGIDAKNQMAYREIYIHSKLMLIDDVFVTLGSANLNQRSMSVDSEINIAATGEAMASELRRRVFELQSGGDIRGSGDRSDIPNLFDKWNARMKDNLVVSMKSIRRMKGFLLPFEDHRATSTMHASITVPSSTNTATV